MGWRWCGGLVGGWCGDGVEVVWRVSGEVVWIFVATVYYFCGKDVPLI